MSHTFHKMWIHAIWSTKERNPLLSTNIEKQVYDYMHLQFAELNCKADIINGMPDHIHCLFQLNPDIAVEKILKQVKGSTSHFINHNDLIPEKFSWQTGYATFSVSESQKNKVKKYIENQKAHHIKKTFMQEYEEFMHLYGFGQGLN